MTQLFDRRGIVLMLAAALAATAIGSPAFADKGSGGGSGGGGGDGGGDDGGGGDDNSGPGNGNDDDDAREASHRGETQPIDELLRRVSKRYPGDVVGVRARRRGGSLVYDVKLISGDGRLIRVRIDAKSGDLMGVIGR